MTPFKVMTFNLRGAYFAEPSRHSWDVRAPLCAELIQREAPDLIGFQEFQQGNLESLSASLPNYGYTLGFPITEVNATGRPMHNAIFWQRDRLELLGTGGFYLSATPERYSLDLDSRSRALTWAMLRESTGGQVFVHGNVHLAHAHLSARQAGAATIIEQMHGISRGGPAVLTGDFNERPRDFTPEEQERVSALFGQEKLQHNAKGATLERFVGAGYRDAYREQGGDETLDSCNGFVGWPKVGHRLDWILLHDGGSHKLRARSARILDEVEASNYPSDHYPVVAALELTAEPGKDGAAPGDDARGS